MNQIKKVSAFKFLFVKMARWLKKRKPTGKLYLTLVYDTEEAYSKVRKLQELLKEVRAQIKEINKTRVYIDVVKKERPS